MRKVIKITYLLKVNWDNWCMNNFFNKTYFENRINSDSFDLNKRLDSILHDLSRIKIKNIKRICEIALPFLNLYKPAQLIISVGLGGYQVIVITVDLCRNLYKHKFVESGKDVLRIAMVVSSLAMTIFTPTLGLLLSSTKQISIDIYRCGVMIGQKRYAEAGSCLYRIVNQIIYLAATFYATPELTLLSLIGQALIEFGQTIKECKNKRFPEAIANLLMGCIRIYQAAPHAERVHRNYFGMELTEQNLPILLKDIAAQKEKNSPELVDLDKILKDHYFSSRIKNISFSKHTTDLTKIAFKDICFTACDFNKVDFSNSLFNRVSFLSSGLNDAKFYNVILNDVKFSGSCLNNTGFQNSYLYKVLFHYCEMEKSTLVENDIINTTFNNCNMNDSEFFSIFLHSTIKNSSADRSDFSGSDFIHSTVKNSSFKNANFCT